MRLIARMLREEWRLQSSIFGRTRFAFLPFLVLGFSTVISWITLRYSIAGPQTLSTSYGFLAGFLGLAAGTTAFSSSDALENVLGPMNLLIYSSRTLPISEKRLFLSFIISDLIYYTTLFMLPIGLGAALAGASLPQLTLMPLFFVAGTVLSVGFALSSIRTPSTPVKFGYTGRALDDLSITTLARSSGGLTKPVFSMGILAGLFLVTSSYFPAASLFLNNISLSFASLMGITSLSVYNWINRFDGEEDYSYLPVSRTELLESKQRTYLLIATPLSLTFLAPFLLVSEPSTWVISALVSVSNLVFTMGIASVLTGVNPNKKLYDSKTFLEYLGLNSVFVVPLLIISVYYTQKLAPLVILLSGLATALGIGLTYLTRN